MNHSDSKRFLLYYSANCILPATKEILNNIMWIKYAANDFTHSENIVAKNTWHSFACNTAFVKGCAFVAYRMLKM